MPEHFCKIVPFGEIDGFPLDRASELFLWLFPNLLLIAEILFEMAIKGFMGTRRALWREMMSEAQFSPHTPSRPKWFSLV